MTAPSTAPAAGDKVKLPPYSFTTIKAWQFGHELNLEAHTLLQEYRTDPDAQPWCRELATALKESVVQIMEAFRKQPRAEKLRRYESSLFYISRIHYLIYLGNHLGIWELNELLSRVGEYQALVRATANHFLPAKPVTQASPRREL